MAILIAPAGPIIVAMIDLEVDCSSDTIVGDAVYVSGNDLVAPAKADSLMTMPALGIVVRKTSSTHCFVRRLAETTVFSGLTPGASYRISELIAGSITSDAPPAPGILPVFVYQSIGWAVSPTNFAIDPDPSDRVVVY